MLALCVTLVEFGCDPCHSKRLAHLSGEGFVIRSIKGGVRSQPRPDSLVGGPLALTPGEPDN